MTSNAFPIQLFLRQTSHSRLSILQIALWNKTFKLCFFPRAKTIPLTGGRAIKFLITQPARKNVFQENSTCLLWMEVKAQFGNQSLGVHSGAAKLLKTGQSAQGHLKTTRRSLWMLSEVQHRREGRIPLPAPGKTRISAPGTGTGYTPMKIPAKARLKCVNAIIL